VATYLRFVSFLAGNLYDVCAWGRAGEERFFYAFASNGTGGFLLDLVKRTNEVTASINATPPANSAAAC
jgi:hypothetical protein